MIHYIYITSYFKTIISSNEVTFKTVNCSPQHQSTIILILNKNQSHPSTDERYNLFLITVTFTPRLQNGDIELTKYTSRLSFHISLPGEAFQRALATLLPKQCSCVVQFNATHTADQTANPIFIILLCNQIKLIALTIKLTRTLED